MKEVLFAAMGAVMLAAASGAWAEDTAGPEAKRPLKALQEDFLKLKFGMFIQSSLKTLAEIGKLLGEQASRDNAGPAEPVAGER